MLTLCISLTFYSLQFCKGPAALPCLPCPLLERLFRSVGVLQNSGRIPVPPARPDLVELSCVEHLHSCVSGLRGQSRFYCLLHKKVICGRTAGGGGGAVVCNLFNSGSSDFSFMQGLRLSFKHFVRHGCKQLLCQNSRAMLG